MRELGLNAYRFSISWSRVLPDGTRARSTRAGLDFYRRLVDALLEHGIEPLVTLYHWDLPAALDDRGGWLNRDIADWFADYAASLFARARRPRRDVGDAQRAVGRHRRRLPARRAGARPPQPASRRRSRRTTCCARTARRCRPTAPRARHAIGLVVNLEPKYPASASAEDVAATRARRRLHEPPVPRSGVPRRATPRSCAEIFGEAWPDSPAADLDADPPADRLPRHQLLHARRHARTTPTRLAGARRARAPAPARPTPRPAGRSTRRG